MPVEFQGGSMRSWYAESSPVRPSSQTRLSLSRVNVHRRTREYRSAVPAGAFGAFAAGRLAQARMTKTISAIAVPCVDRRLLRARGGRERADVRFSYASRWAGPISLQRRRTAAGLGQPVRPAHRKCNYARPLDLH